MWCCLLWTTAVAGNDYRAIDYGARADGKTLDHGAINKAIQTAHEAGGGRVVLTTGTYLCGSIRMKSDVELHLMAGAKVLAAPASMKAYGLFARHVDGLTLRNVRFELMRPDERPDIILDDVTNHSIQQ